jgi:8-oxo-dGTP diphosphatase
MKKPPYDTARPYLASFVILRKDNKVAFVLRNNTDWRNGYYGLPAGKAEHDESALETAVREVKEEAGVVVDKKDLTFLHMRHRKSEDDTLQWIDIVYEATKWKGEPYNAEPKVHSELKWFDLDNLPDNVVPEFYPLIDDIKAGKMYSEYGWEE